MKRSFFVVLFVLLYRAPGFAQLATEDIFADLRLDDRPAPVQGISAPDTPPAEPSFPIEASRAQAPEPVRIEMLLAEGKTAYDAGEWSTARAFFEAALFNDPYNTAATAYLRRIAEKTRQFENRGVQATRSRMLTDVRAAWNTPKAEGARAKGDMADSEAAEARTDPLREKLSAIQIARFELRESGIGEAVAELSSICRGADGQGVNFVVLGLTDVIIPPVTFSGSDLTALEALDIITQMGGLKYEIGEGRVTVTPVNYEPPQQMVTREFDVIPAVGRKMVALSAAEAAGGMIDVSRFFGTVPFPGGASAWYNPEFDVLLVRNAPKHLAGVEALLERYNRRAMEERSRQVEIETKFIEVAEGALQEMGFDWSTPDGIQMDDVRIPAGENLFVDGFRDTQTAMDGIDADALGLLLNGGPGTLLFKKTAGFSLNLLIRALQQSSGADLLSAPKVLTQSGETATIHIGEIHSFPTAFDIQLERYAMPALVPLDYEKEHTGVMLEVTPELDPDTGLIEMTLDPEIRELAGFDEQHVGTIWFQGADAVIDEFTVYRDTAYAGSGLTATNAVNAYSTALLDYLTGREKERAVNADRLIARTPVFRTRKVHTKVTIEDGSTIMMGGLIKESFEHFKDRVPVLGSIPLLGRFFRSEGERSIKKNLLIFVTANRIDSAGYRNAL
jgi:general secretion pathway protein D